jgi:methylated-DNA-[protein]-cysteine S-methyltransferase
MKNYVHKFIESPVGKLKLVASNHGLAAILWENDNPRRVRLGETTEDNSHPVLLETERQLKDYFARKRKSFCLELDLVGTAFQKHVWEALLAIPFGETRSYAQLAEQVGNPRATRAVGTRFLS